MLKSITQTLQRRREDIAERADVSVIAQNAVRDFIGENYPDAVTRVTVRYEPAERVLIILTPSKTLAGELVLNSREIRAHLAAQNVRVSRIIAR